MKTKVLQLTHYNCSMSKDILTSYKDTIRSLHEKLEIETNYTGWLHYIEHNHEELLSRIEKIAVEIRQEADVLIVVGIGGSFLGARAILDVLTPILVVKYKALKLFM